jgi:hypothetical protein
MTRPETEAVLRLITYRDWQFHVGERSDGDLYLQVRFLSSGPEGPLQSGRKWLFSPYMTQSEVVQTALKAVLTAEEHEARERFRYRGAAVFGPHLDVEALVAIADREDRRESRDDV